jgi:hypothetical protein
MYKAILIIALGMLMGCSSPPPAPAPVPPTTKTITMTQPAPQMILPPDFPDVLKRLAVVEGKILMVESNQKLAIPQLVTDSLKKQQAQIDALVSLKYDIEAIKFDLTSIKARLVVIEAKAGITAP